MRDRTFIRAPPARSGLPRRSWHWPTAVPKRVARGPGIWPAGPITWTAEGYQRGVLATLIAVSYSVPRFAAGSAVETALPAWSRPRTRGGAVIEEVEARVRAWLAEAAAGADIWLDPPRAGEQRKGVGLYLLELGEAPPPRGASPA